MRVPILKLRGDNFTDPSRTPWGGDRLAAWKRSLGIDARAPLGESWEVSFGPELPSFVEGTGRTLGSFVQDDLLGYLGDEAALGTSCLLVKLLDARTPLSVQIHPSDHDALRDGESGKPECWYIAAADPGASVLFGLSDDASPSRMADALAGGHDVSSLLTRVPVVAGDFFVVPPGTPHAIGGGVTVVEPQHVAPKKRGVTYRYWDWNHRYDASGALHAEGLPRALHIDDALRVTEWDEARGARLATQAKTRLPPPEPTSALQLSPLAGKDGLPFVVEVLRLSGSGSLVLPLATVGRSITVIDGELLAHAEGITERARRGESLFVAATARVTLEAAGVVALIASTPVSSTPVLR